MIDEMEKFQYLFTEDGAADVADGISRFKEVYAENWLKEFNAANPDLVFIIDLVANYDVEEALVNFKQYIFDLIENSGDSELVKFGKRAIFRRMFAESQKSLINLHTRLKAEIDKPRY